ncbi:centromere protein N [Sorex araneus]|uniref:centromere protein N n=1 Tax=Sorex araneus TaxID=42254 RepID=UPI00243364E1|nr:centromere protein N [Sorex araneus]XP_055001921.1 centromere protein N [Sorex araneus]
MDEILEEFLRRTLWKMPIAEIVPVLKAWDFLSENQLQSLNLRQRKELLIRDVVLLCEEKKASLQDAALLDLTYTQLHQHQKVWDVFQMNRLPGEDSDDLFDMEQFKQSFKKVLQRALKNVTVTFKDAEENAVWIRVAWGSQYKQPNQYHPTFVVYHEQTRYAFVSSSRLKSTATLLGQALVVASKHHQIVKMDLRSRYLASLKAIVFKQYNQIFETHDSSSPLRERSLNINMDPRVTHENIVKKERVRRVTQETFGDYPQPRLEFAQYKLETKFKSGGRILADKEEPLRCLVKFSSPNLMEALRSLAPAGIADAPLSSLLTCIPREGVNYFKIRDK